MLFKVLVVLFLEISLFSGLATASLPDDFEPKVLPISDYSEGRYHRIAATFSKIELPDGRIGYSGHSFTTPDQFDCSLYGNLERSQFQSTFKDSGNNKVELINKTLKVLTINESSYNVVVCDEYNDDGEDQIPPSCKSGKSHSATLNKVVISFANPEDLVVVTQECSQIVR